MLSSRKGFKQAFKSTRGLGAGLGPGGGSRGGSRGASRDGSLAATPSSSFHVPSSSSSSAPTASSSFLAGGGAGGGGGGGARGEGGRGGDGISRDMFLSRGMSLRSNGGGGGSGSGSGRGAVSAVTSGHGLPDDDSDSDSEVCFGTPLLPTSIVLPPPPHTHIHTLTQPIIRLLTPLFTHPLTPFHPLVSPPPLGTSSLSTGAPSSRRGRALGHSFGGRHLHLLCRNGRVHR